MIDACTLAGREACVLGGAMPAYLLGDPRHSQRLKAEACCAGDEPQTRGTQHQPLAKDE